VAGTVAEIAFFVALVVVIVIHEAAHFGMAKWFGIKVEEFFVGFGPRLWSTRRGETEYGVKAIPAGGYVKIAGMNPYQEIPHEELPRTFGQKPIWQRALVIFAGPATHFVLAFLALAIWLFAVGQPVARSPLIAGVGPTLQGRTSPAASAGLRPGDRIVGVDGITNPTDVQLVRFTRAHVGEPVTLRIERDDRAFTVTLTPVLSKVGGKKVGRIGVLLGQARETSGLLGSIAGATRLVGTGVVDSVKGVARLFGPEGIGRMFTLLFTNAQRRPTDPVSVVGVGAVAAQTASGGRFWDLLYIFALVNVFIGLLNLLPLPPFDGGHLAVLAIEKVRGRKVDMRKLIPISAAVAAIFVLLFVAIVYLDITKPVHLSP
jgi:membrane-associated protease RseP (regulator of RpoE activity)